MSIYDYESAFGAEDKTSSQMRKAVEEWFSLYYDQEKTNASDPCQRIPYTVVGKIVRTVFGEYAADADTPFAKKVIRALDIYRQEAMQLALIGGECYIKPVVETDGFSFALVPRNNVLIFARDSRGEPMDVGLAERSTQGKFYYTLLERRWVDEYGYLTIENKLYRSLNAQSLGGQVELSKHPRYAQLADSYRYEKPLHGVGLVRMKTPMLNCVDGSPDGVSVYAAAVGLIKNINENEAQLGGEFSRGESRVFVSSDLLDGENGLTDHLFTGLNEDPEQVGITVFSPQLRESAFLSRKQEYLRNVESILGLKRGMLSDANVEDRTATEIAASAGEFNLTVMDFQRLWEYTLRKTVSLCAALGEIYRMADAEDGCVTVDWGNGVLYDEEKLWQTYMEMVTAGLLKPETALGWRFNMPAGTEKERAAIRERYMPENTVIDA